MRRPGAAEARGLGAPQDPVPGRLGAADAGDQPLPAGCPKPSAIATCQSFDDSMRACEQALSQWVAREIGPLHCLRPSFHMQVLDGHGNYIDQYRDGQRQELLRLRCC